MSVENGEWIMHGLRRNAPDCIRTAAELTALVDTLGFLPLFACGVQGFSVEERTVPGDWWTDDPGRDPWMWREQLAREGHVAYGKFFGGRAGFLSRKWFPVFANYRRDGYDFDALWEDEKASLREKKIMDLFSDPATRLFSHEVKRMAGFMKGGEKNFDGTVTGLEMKTYLVMRDFRRRRNKQGQEYGWNLAIYARPEELFGYEQVTACYEEDPQASFARLVARAKELNPGAEEKQLVTLLK